VELEGWNGALFSFSLVANMIVTSLIALRIWFVSSPTFQNTRTFINYQRVLVLIIGSGFIY
ncbi:hypothetical protein L218DRAFT_802262, partial [Marasmius fiardii PR-910]